MNPAPNKLLARALFEKTLIEDSLPFGRLSEKTQVVFPQNGLFEVPKNRATHSYEVSSSSKMMAIIIANRLELGIDDIDYMHVMENVSLLHDIGHPPFGHDGSYFLDSYLKKRGLSEGFDDNNNNLVVIDKNEILVSDYTISSIIKYPHKLYSWQQERYLPILKYAIDQDKAHYRKFGINLKGMKTTIACQIMDEADRNSYVCTDLADFLSMGNTLNLKKLRMMSGSFALPDKYAEEMMQLVDVAIKGNKRAIKSFLSKLKHRFNSNYMLTDNGIVEIDAELMQYREFLNDVSREFYIKPIRKMQLHGDNMNKLLAFTNHVFNEDFYPSSTYSSRIISAESSEDKLRFMRDMIAEVSDWYVINSCNKLNLETNLRFTDQLSL